MATSLRPLDIGLESALSLVTGLEGVFTLEFLVEEKREPKKRLTVLNVRAFSLKRFDTFFEQMA